MHVYPPTKKQSREEHAVEKKVRRGKTKEHASKREERESRIESNLLFSFFSLLHRTASHGKTKPLSLQYWPLASAARVACIRLCDGKKVKKKEVKKKERKKGAIAMAALFLFLFPFLSVPCGLRFFSQPPAKCVARHCPRPPYRDPPVQPHVSAARSQKPQRFPTPHQRNFVIAFRRRPLFSFRSPLLLPSLTLPLLLRPHTEGRARQARQPRAAPQEHRL